MEWNSAFCVCNNEYSTPLFQQEMKEIALHCLEESCLLLCTSRVRALVSTSGSAGSINMETDMTCMSQQFPVEVEPCLGPSPRFSRHSWACTPDPVHSISVSLCPPAHMCLSFHASCVSICVLSLAVLHAPLGPVRIKGHFSKGQSSHFQRWRVTGAVSSVRRHWTSAQLRLDK